MPRWFTRSLWILILLSWIPLALVLGRRGETVDHTRISIITHMDKQQRYSAQAPCELFADGRAMRPQVPGTVAREQGAELDAFRTGKEDGLWVESFPVGVDAALMERGRERYGIFCASCHGESGYGDGMVHKRAVALEQGAWTPPASFHTDLVRGRTPGQLFNTISLGIRNMPAHESQIPEKDRWAIVAYVKALQRSQHAGLADVPEDHQAGLR